jgi:hypothetical protein
MFSQEFAFHGITLNKIIFTTSSSILKRKNWVIYSKWHNICFFIPEYTKHLQVGEKF